MAQSFTKTGLSGDTNGSGILIAATSTLGNTIHTAVASTSATTWDEVWLYASNVSGAVVTLTIEWTTATTSNNIIITIPSKSGRILVIDGAIVQNAKVITAFASITNVCLITGFVHNIA